MSNQTTRTMLWRIPKHLGRYQRTFTRSSDHSRSAVPTYFNDPKSVPLPYTSSSQDHPETDSPLYSKSETFEKKTTTTKDFAFFIAVTALSYLALDNYLERIKLERMNQDTTAINLKTLQLQQQNFMKARKQQELKMLKERIEVSKRCFKMALHIAILKKQLEDAGMEPKAISDALNEFENTAKISNSIQNLTGNAMWLAEESQYKSLMPDYREYDRKGKWSSAEPASD